MKQILRNRAVQGFVAGGAAVGLFAGGVAWAGGSPGPMALGGGAELQTKVKTSGVNTEIASLNTWESIPGAKVQVKVPAGKTRLLTSRFNAETNCTAENLIAGWCSVRIVARKAGGGTIQELHPRVGSDFAIDSIGDETWDGNSAHRSIRLGAGTWDVWVQGLVSGTSGAFRVDDWHFETEVNK